MSLSNEKSAMYEVGGVVTNTALYIILQTAVNTFSENRIVDPATTANIVASSINNCLSSVE